MIETLGPGQGFRAFFPLSDGIPYPPPIKRVQGIELGQGSDLTGK